MSDLWTKYRNRNKWKWINRLPQQSDKQSNILQWVCFINNSWCCFTGGLQTDDQTSFWLAGTRAHSCKPISWKLPTSKHLSSLSLNAKCRSLGKNLKFPHLIRTSILHSIFILKSDQFFWIARDHLVSMLQSLLMWTIGRAFVVNPLIIRTEIETKRG